MKDDRNIMISFEELYSLIGDACEQKAELKYIKNAVKANVPTNYIYSMLDGQKHWEDYTILNGPFYGEIDETEENDGNS